MNPKKVAGEKAYDYIKEEMVVGLGSGTTVYWFIKKLGKMVEEGLKIKGVPTSKETENLANDVNIPLMRLQDIDSIDITVDGADEVDEDFNLIKGGGGALLREKIVAAASKQLVIVVDESKIVKKLGKFPLPVEVNPFGWKKVSKEIEKTGCKAKVRKKNNKNYRTDNGNFILDCDFEKIDDPLALNDRLNSIPGIVENGLFPDMADVVVVGKENGEYYILENNHNAVK